MESLRDDLARVLRLAEAALSEGLRNELLDIAAQLSEELIQSSQRDPHHLSQAERPMLRLVRLPSEYVCRSKDVVIGTIEPHGEMWRWQIVGIEVHVCGAEPEGVAETLNAAYRALSESWQAWLAAAGLIECLCDPVSFSRVQQSRRNGAARRG